MLTLKDVTKTLGGPEFEEIARELLSEKGLKKLPFEALLREIFPDASDAAIDLHRMNCAGGLRSVGYDLEGGRSNRHLPYRIIGWTLPVAKPDRSSWDDSQKEVEKWLKRLPLSDPRYTETWLRLGVFAAVSKATWSWFEHSYLNLASYKIQRPDATYLYVSYGVSTKSSRAVICQKFTSRPRFSVVNYGLQPIEIFEIVEKLAKISYGSIVVENIPPDEIPVYRELFPHGSLVKNPEAIYDCDTFANRPETKFSKRDLSYIRQHSRNCEWLVTEEQMYEDSLKSVISIWKESQEEKHRRLSIRRDFRAIETPATTKIMMLGLREDHPVAAVVADRLLNSPKIAAKIVEKSLNYRNQPAGAPGTGAWTLFETCKSLLERGVTQYNGGWIHGGAMTLAEHKLKYADDVIVQYDFNTGYRIYEEKSPLRTRG